MSTSGPFYDSAAANSLADYVYGNPRLEAAIGHALRWIPPEARSIIDVGCGMGWSTWEIKRNFAGASVLGIDLSAARLKLASTLFSAPGLTFAVASVLEMPVPEASADVAVMLDVYEHVPKSGRPALYEALEHVLAVHGLVILSCPSTDHQNYLRNNHPERLQPVDEDVSRDDLDLAARSIGGKLVYFRELDIWRPGDYFHAVISRAPCRKDPPKRDHRPVRCESVQVRSNRVLRQTRLRVSRGGILLPQKVGLCVCVVQPNRLAYSETFIRAHIEKLPATVHMLYGGWFPTRKEDDRRLLPFPFAEMDRVQSRLPGRFASVYEYSRNRLFSRFLRKRRVNVVLAEYGPTGVSIMDACRVAGIPFVAHFHGYDAYDQTMLRKYQTEYRRMFSESSALIAVSRDMEAQLLRLGAPPGKIHWIPCGVDVSLFDGADPAAAAPVFVAVGRFRDKKAPHLTLLAFRKVLQRVPDARLIMIGEGDLLEACKQIVRTFGIEGSVDFMGARAHHEVAAIMRTARAFVQHSTTTSYGDSEGTPVAVLEAGAAGLPVVGTRHAGIKDAVRHNETGYLVEEHDIDGMSAFMIELAENPQMAAALGRRAREHIAANFSLERSIERLWHVLQDAAARSF